MQRLEFSGAVRLIYRSLGVRGLSIEINPNYVETFCSYRSVNTLSRGLAANGYTLVEFYPRYVRGAMFGRGGGRC